jgi:hypothetical protein
MKPLWIQLRILVVELIVGLALGILVWELYGRRILAFKYGSLGSSVTCAPDVERALAEFDSGLRLAGVIGAAGFVALTLVIRFLLWRRTNRRNQEKASVASNQAK